MGVEIELKVRVTDPEGLARQLDTIGSFQRRYRKEDRYFGHAADPVHTLFRLRRDDRRWICTLKKKQIIDRTEHNEETEFEVSDGDAFRRFAEALGLEVVVEKKKTGKLWIVDGINAELSTVNDIGDFLELEFMLPDDSSVEAVRNARESLFHLLQRLGISRSALESRSYTQIIHENISASPQTAGSGF
jgi:adenylate cyclase, class 2